MEFRILGPLEVSKNGRLVEIGGRKQRALLASLLLHANEVVSPDRLIDELWGESPPPTAAKTLQAHVSRLRRSLNGDEDPVAHLYAPLETRGPGYVLKLEPGQLDADSFKRLLEDARRSLAEGEPKAAAEKVERALALWRGPALADLAYESFAQAEIARLDELRLSAQEERIEADLALGRHRELVGELEQLVTDHPLRERLRGQLMLALYRSDRQAEALQAYQRGRLVLAEDLGLEPSQSLQQLERQILEQDPALAAPASPAPSRRRPRGWPLVVLGILALAAALAAVVLLVDRDGGPAAVAASDPPPLEIPPTSLVRLDPDTLEPTQVVRIGPRADLVAVAGGYVWITHGLLRYTDDDYLRDAGDRTLTRVDPSTGDARVVGGGLAPCGLAAAPSGDVWVANCFASATGANVVRVDARTLEFEATWPVPAGDGYYRGMAYGTGALWVADASGVGDHRRVNVTQLNPRTGARRSIGLARHASALAWSEGHGDLWMTNFVDRSVSRLHAATEESKTFDSVAKNPGALVVDSNAVWVGDWNDPAVLRLPAVGTGRASRISLPVTARPGGITSVAAGAGGIWAAVPDDRAVWRIDPKTNRTTRIGLPYHPWGVAVGDDGIWVVSRARNE